MGHELTKNDIKKMEEEIEYRIHEVRKAALDDVKELSLIHISEPTRH